MWQLEHSRHIPHDAKRFQHAIILLSDEPPLVKCLPDSCVVLLSVYPRENGHLPTYVLCSRLLSCMKPRHARCLEGCHSTFMHLWASGAVADFLRTLLHAMLDKPGLLPLTHHSTMQPNISHRNRAGGTFSVCTACKSMHLIVH